MNLERLRVQLESILHREVKLTFVSDQEWSSHAQAGEKSAAIRGHMHWFIHMQEDQVRTMCAENAAQLTEAEKRLVEIAVELALQQERKSKSVHSSGEEAKAAALQEWILLQLDAGETDKELPASLTSAAPLYSSYIPILLNGDFTENRAVSYKELRKLLESFFEERIILIPIKEREWLILCPERFMNGSKQEDKAEDEYETVEDALESFCSGLHEMVVTEWLGDCHLSATHAIIPAKSLLSAIVELREAIFLGRTFHVGENIHMPWRVHLERILHLIPEQEKLSFLERILKRADYFADTEMMLTLEQFFQLDCNVSETAKKLYIHRNTLLYRLDKFKQETGFDVRNFSEAVLVKIALLLYKVTKR